MRFKFQFADRYAPAGSARGQCVIGAAGIVTRSLCSVTSLPFKFQFSELMIIRPFLVWRFVKSNATLR